MYKFLVFLLLQISYCSCYELYDLNIKGNALHGYYISSSIGTPPQRIDLLIDTGSSNLAVAAYPQKTFISHFLYNESLTFHPSDITVQLQYIQGIWTGFIGLDIFNVCLKHDCSVICNISCMTSGHDIFDDNTMFQGILGLAYPSIVQPNSSIRPFLDIFFEEKNITNIFAMSLCGPFFSSKEISTQCGQLHIGYYSKSQIVGDIMFTPIVHEWFYEITVVDMKVDQHSVPVKCEEFNKNKSIVDSGITNLNLPIKIYEWVMSEIKNHVKKYLLDNFWFNETVICKGKNIDLSKFPSITLSIYHSHNKLFNLHVSPELYLLPVINSSCAMLAIGTSDYGIVIGSSILRGFYVIFDRENKRIGFAKLKEIKQFNFISEVSDLLIYSSNLNNCIRKDNLADSSFPALLGLILLCLIFITFCVLLPLITWLWKYHVKKKRMDRSDIINLVEDD